MKQYQVGIVGAGFIGMAHLEALRRLGNVRVAALCDTRGAKEKAGAAGVPEAFSDYRAMVDTLPLDAVHICTPNHTHYAVADYALEHGLHVLCEKPLTATTGQARQLARLAEEKGLHAAVNYHNRFYPMARQIKDLVAQGALGNILSVHGAYLQDWLLYETDYSWRLQGEEGGKTRAVADIGSHWLDLAQYVTGLKVCAVNAAMRTYYGTRYRPAVGGESFSRAGGKGEPFPVRNEDMAALLLRFETGAIGTLMLSQMAAGKKNKLTLAVAGTRSAAYWDSESCCTLEMGCRDGANLVYEKSPATATAGAAALISYPAGHIEGFPDALKQCFSQFYRSLEDPAAGCGCATLEEGLNQVALCDAIFESAQAGKWVEIGGEVQ